MIRFRIKIVGESGSGLLSTGDILMQSLVRAGFHATSDREYPSLIKGGASCYTLNFSDENILSLSKEADVVIALDLQGLEAYHGELKTGGILLHGYERGRVIPIANKVRKEGGQVHELKARELAHSVGGTVLMTNMVLLGYLWKLMGLPAEFLEDSVRHEFADKPKLLEIDLKCLEVGASQVPKTEFQFELPKKGEAPFLMNAHQSLSLGAVHAGCRAYYAYPMSPSSNILTYMAEMAEETGMLVKQAEDEITVAQLAIGSMFMGTRALAATSGGGFDLMTESLSLVGMIENPFVLVIAQRPGPATGLPTWTAQGDLNLALYSGHGSFPRVVMAISDPDDAFSLIQHAFNLAEEFQVPVLVLSEKVVAETLFTLQKLEQNTIPIRRGLVTQAAELKTLQNADRYKITESGLSKRWLPGTAEAYYFANGDEHGEDGSLTEDADEARAMMEKRMRKEHLVQEALPDPQIYGPKAGADLSFVGWGSSKHAVLDAMKLLSDQGKNINYCHLSYLNPLKTELLKEFFANNQNIHLIEGNMEGQLGRLIEHALKVDFRGKFLKYDGRPFFLEDVLTYSQEQL